MAVSTSWAVPTCGQAEGHEDTTMQAYLTGQCGCVDTFS